MLQITGRTNYQKVATALGLDCVAHPELLESRANACRSAAWWWKEHGLNELADLGEFRQITKRINGGYNGEAERLRYYQVALGVLR